MSTRGGWADRAWRLAGLALVAAQLAAFVPALYGERELFLRRHGARSITAEQARDIRVIRSWIPDAEPLLYVSNSENRWLPRLWERALSPQRVAIVVSTDDAVKRVAFLRKRLRIRWALSAGSPPPDPGFVWHVRLSPIPGFPQEYWFGKLAK
jgi:hypothetical protein